MTSASKLPGSGDQAPDFTAGLYPSGTFTLSSLKGQKNVILAFYPKDSTPGCTKEMCSFSADLSRFEDSQTMVVGVSRDSLSSHEKFTARYNLSLPLISDPEGEVGRLYGALVEGRNSFVRKLFVIDKSGKIAHVHDGMPDNNKLIEIVGNLH